MSKPYVEPEYLVLTKIEKRSITKTLLLFPILCILILSLLCVGELDPMSELPSFTKLEYFFEANRIVGDFCNGNTDSVMAHNLAYFDNGTVNYVYYSGIQDIYDGGAELLKEIYDIVLEDEMVISFVGMPRAQYQTHLSKYTDENERSFIWHAIGFVYVGRKDVLQIDIQFISPEVYYIFLSPTLPELDESATFEEKAALATYKQSPEYALLEQTEAYMRWVFNISSSQSEDTIKYFENVFAKQNLSATLLQQFITRYFTNEGNYLNKDFTDEIKNNYQSNLAWMLYGLGTEVSIIDSEVSYGMYDKTTKSISLSLMMHLQDDNGKQALMTIPVFYTVAGYQIFPDNIVCLAEEGFVSERLPQLIEFLKYDRMPEDLLIERAAYELNKRN